MEKITGKRKGDVGRSGNDHKRRRVNEPVCFPPAVVGVICNMKYEIGGYLKDGVATKKLTNRCHEIRSGVKCNGMAVYGLPGCEEVYCLNHYKVGTMFDPKAVCKVKKCRRQALYGYNHPVFCGIHKRADTDSMIEWKCEKCLQVRILVANRYCRLCFKKIVYESFGDVE